MSLESLALNAVVPGAGTALSFGQFIKRHLPGMLMMLAVVLIGGGLYWAPWAVSRGAHSRDLEVAGLQRTIADMKAAEAKAKAEAEKHARGVETAQNVATEGTNHEIEDQRDRAMHLAAGYLDQLRSKAAAVNSGGASGAGGAAGTGAAAGVPAGAGGVSQLDADDVRICTANTVKALAVGPWYEKLKAIPR